MIKGWTKKEAKGGVATGGVDAERGVQGLYSWSILAAKMKSLSVRPLILCVQVVISTFHQTSEMSG